ncbi:protein phosphatase 2C domain-containing protein [Lentzea sp. NEAU-D7]|uniref:protein phosphatase 2C domain-containing protein n=1 Tax=Lentzea sp. NEAU-D7 TaxID=2994667 RepID=UPI00224A61C0|nr:protein phosphatase 2C domain-containing protein [Lentzea sp. NEAU-D7]MCX2948110.1 protein phosphatase 2C domain-containing protein [Lentzea sp. NEAU-D7]
MKIETAEQGAPGRVTEDRIRVLPNAVVVLDGVTSRTRPPDRNGGWYASKLADELVRLLDGTDPLTDLLARAISNLVAEHDLVPGDSPAATASVVRWNDDTIEALVLCDSPVVAFGRSTRVLEDTRLEDLRPDPDILRWKNKAGGYWVAEADPAAGHQALTATWRREETESVIALTDGVSCGVSVYGLFSWEDLEQLPLGEVLDRIREAERDDSEHRLWPRHKTHDDQAIARITFSA